MKIIAILFGLALVVLGIANYMLGGGLGLPILLGVLAIIFVLLQERWDHRHPTYATVMMAILAVLSSLRGVINLVRLLNGGESVLLTSVVYVQTTIAGLSILYIILAIVIMSDFWHGWKEFGQFLGDWLARVVLTIFYFTVLIPFGIGVRLLSDPLHIKTKATPFWRPRTTGDQELKEVLRQF